MYCIKCKVNGVGRKRASHGHLICKPCGEETAKRERSTWCVVQEYGKGCYMYVAAMSAPTAVKNTNQKDTRGELYGK